MLKDYRSVWNDMVSLQKTRLAKLRHILGTMGSESVFPKIVGLSASWIKKASAGGLPMTAKAASSIHDATGIDLVWLMGGGPDVPVEADGLTPYGIASYHKWKWTTDLNEGDYPRLYNPISLRMILRALANVSAGRKQTAASCELFEFAQKFKTAYGQAESSGKYASDMLKTLTQMENRKEEDARPFEDRIIRGQKKSRPPKVKPETKKSESSAAKTSLRKLRKS